jgi:hypothetical protein
MTVTAVRPERVAAGEFRVRGVLGRAWSVPSRNLSRLLLVMAIVSLPDLLFTNPGRDGGSIVAGTFVSGVMRALGQAMVLSGAFQGLRGRPMSLAESVRIGLRRIVPVVGLVFGAWIVIWFGLVLAIVPGLMVATMLFVAMPVCVVERAGPIRSMDRSAQLSKGHRWRIFGLLLLTALPLVIFGGAIDFTAKATGAAGILAATCHVILDSIWGVGNAALVVATYHDLRVAKEGAESVQIAAVFD